MFTTNIDLTTVHASHELFMCDRKVVVGICQSPNTVLTNYGAVTQYESW